MARVTTGPEVVRAGSAALLFAAVGLTWVRFGLPPVMRRFGLGEWIERRYVKLWNYGVLVVVGVCGAVAIVVGAIAWATGSTFH